MSTKTMIETRRRKKEKNVKMSTSWYQERKKESTLKMSIIDTRRRKKEISWYQEGEKEKNKENTAKLIPGGRRCQVQQWWQGLHGGKGATRKGAWLSGIGQPGLYLYLHLYLYLYLYMYMYMCCFSCFCVSLILQLNYKPQLPWVWRWRRTLKYPAGK